MMFIANCSLFAKRPKSPFNKKRKRIKMDRKSSSAGSTNLMDCSPPSLRFQVRKWTAVALWAYDITVDNCAICRNHIMDKCIECQSVQEMTDVDESCTIAWGKCSHVFHMHCISRWLNTRQVCPLDNRPWEFKKYGTGGGGVVSGSS